ncbi:hypothetical protein F5888DRAFT_1726880 [Russula emetica]|nr:hypothetical protein F5888DRAFT_1726880 [Russula emetica]
MQVPAVGIESGRRIVEILRKNPTKNPDAYDEEDIAHIRKVVSYNSRHLAQEDHLKETKTTAQLAKAKSTISLKNRGHGRVSSGYYVSLVFVLYVSYCLMCRSV